jgi:hypothetical protein
MTSFGDQLKLGGAQYAPATATTAAGYVLGYSDLENTGVPVTPVYYYAVTTPSTSLASGIVYITTSASGTLSATGALVSGGVATIDFPRALQITATTNISTALITIRGTDGYGQAMTWTGIGPTGNTLGAAGSFVITNKAFKTVSTASISAAATGGILIGTSDTYGLPYRVGATNRVVGLFVDGFSFGSSAGTVTASFSATGAAHTASGTDVRGLVALPTAVLANGTRNYAIGIISPSFNVAPSANESTANTYGATQFSS